MKLPIKCTLVITVLPFINTLIKCSLLFVIILVWNSKYRCISALDYKFDTCEYRIAIKPTVPSAGSGTLLTGEISNLLVDFITIIQ